MDYLTIPTIGLVLAVLVVACYFDLKRKEIPNELTYAVIIFGFFYSLFPWTWLNIILASIFFIVGYYINSKGWLGGGDVKLITGMILLTPPDFFSFQFFISFAFFSCLCALAYYAVVVLAGKERLSTEAVIKFAPCIAVGYFVAVMGFLWL